MKKTFEVVDGNYGIFEYGPILEVIFVRKSICDVYRKAGKRVPSKKYTAIIDTASTFTTVSKAVVKDLGLKTVSTQESGTAAGVETQEVHDPCVIYLLGLKMEFDIDYPCSLPFVSKDFQILIGRDLLKRGKFLYDGSKNLFQLDLI
jgi:hypothetical protein